MKTTAEILKRMNEAKGTEINTDAINTGIAATLFADNAKILHGLIMGYKSPITATARRSDSFIDWVLAGNPQKFRTLLSYHKIKEGVTIIGDTTINGEPA